jgi:hypothetical protein
MPHPVYALVCACLIALVTAAVGRQSPLERLYAAARVLAGCTVAVLCGSWLMRLLHG